MRARVAIAVFLLLACCTFDAWQGIGEALSVRQFRGKDDHVSRAAPRFEAIRDALPTRGTVGYRFLGKDSVLLENRHLAQYHLAPLVVEAAGTQEIVLEDDGSTVRQLPPGKRIETADATPAGSRSSSTPAVLAAARWFWLVWAWGLPVLAMYCGLNSRLGEREQRERPAHSGAWIAWKAGASLAIGLAVSSALFALWNTLCGPPQTLYAVLESALWIGIIALSRRKTMDGAAPQPARPSAAGVVGLAAIGALMALAAWECSVWHERCPHGINDAVTIWNLRARFLNRAPDYWADAFGPGIWHADYPLLLPASVSRAWWYAGSEWPGVPAALGDLFALSLVTTWTATLWMLRGPVSGSLIGIALLGASQVVLQSISQIADVPLACFVAVAVTGWLVARRWPGTSSKAWLVVGLSLGSSLWLKNEGLSFAVLGGLAVLACERPRFSREALRSHWGPLAAGGSLFLAAWIAFHVSFPTSNDLVDGQGAGTVQRLLDGNRHAQILGALAFEVLKVGPALLLAVAVYAALMGIDRGSPQWPIARGPALLLASQLLVYYLVYLTSPHDLAWHLQTSAERVLLHLWPSACGLLLLIARTPAERAAFDAARDEERLAAYCRD